jgi:hypothetical protein
MSEQLMVCKALAALVRNTGDPTEEEVSFIAHAAFEMSLTSAQNEEVQKVLKEGGEYGNFIKDVTSRPMRTFLFRRVVAATLIDEKIEDSEMAIINQTAEAFGYKDETVKEYLGWMQEGIAWEKRGAELMAKL